MRLRGGPHALSALRSSFFCSVPAPAPCWVEGQGLGGTRLSRWRWFARESLLTSRQSVAARLAENGDYCIIYTRHHSISNFEAVAVIFARNRECLAVRFGVCKMVDLVSSHSCRDRMPDRLWHPSPLSAPLALVVVHEQRVLRRRGLQMKSRGTERASGVTQVHVE